MALGNTVLFGMITRKMDYSSQRQRIIAQNVANADTPNYAARDLKSLTFKQNMELHGGAVRVATSAPGHIAVRLGNEGFESATAGRPYETAVSENSVILEEQMMKLAETNGDYNFATGLYRKYMQMHRAAVSSNGR